MQMGTPGKDDESAIQNNSRFNSTMMALFLPVGLSHGNCNSEKKRTKKKEKYIPFKKNLQCFKNSHKP